MADHKEQVSPAPKIVELLRATNVMDLPCAKGSIVTVDGNQDPEESFKLLCDNQVLSAPVFDHGRFVGFLDMKDLVQYVVHAAEGEMESRESHHNRVQHHIQHMREAHRFLDLAIRGAHAQASHPVSNAYLAKMHAKAFVSHEASLYDAARLLASGSHRVAVLNQDGQVVNVISQSSIMHFIHHHIASFEDELLSTVADLHLGKSPVACVTENDSTLQVLKLMATRNLSGVCVLDETKTSWIATTTGSDLKLYLAQPCLELLQQPILSFLNGTSIHRPNQHPIRTRNTSLILGRCQICIPPCTLR
eukprot:TRINITY_DN1483_c0_g1_i8.p1 TRINITY_DN1483_c0_g1~~TRINITY_DN1483_c0_g1_i8.p1  ORF type:complete len:305 (+),score=84.24 TRINITY_DN1483_c0_g1_i8:73-987(+)